MGSICIMENGLCRSNYKDCNECWKQGRRLPFAAQLQGMDIYGQVQWIKVRLTYKLFRVKRYLVINLGNCVNFRAYLMTK